MDKDRRKAGERTRLEVDEVLSVSRPVVVCVREAEVGVRQWAHHRVVVRRLLRMACADAEGGQAWRAFQALEERFRCEERV